MSIFDDLSAALDDSDLSTPATYVGQDGVETPVVVVMQIGTALPDGKRFPSPAQYSAQTSVRMCTLSSDYVQNPRKKDQVIIGSNTFSVSNATPYVAGRWLLSLVDPTGV